MKTILLLVCLSACLSGRSEMFFGPSSATNQLLIQKNEALLVQTIIEDKGWFEARLVVSNISYEVGDGDQEEVPFLFAGPAELILEAGNAIQFERIRNASIGMMLVSAERTNVLVQVPAGKRIQFFPPWNDGGTGRGWVKAHLTSGNGHSVSNSRIFFGKPLDGPLAIECFDYEGGPPQTLGSYWITDTLYPAPELLVQDISGALLLVQKSSDLTNWQSVASLQAPLGTNAYYRLNVGSRPSSPTPR